MTKKHQFFLLAFLLALGLDQGTKMWARSTLKPIYPESKTVISGYFEFIYSENPGSAFSLFRGMPGARYFLLIVGIGALAVVGYYLKKAPDASARMGAELGLLAGGAIGNMVDRAMYGKVTDFIVWRYHTHVWPTFNIADAALVIGVIGLAFDTWPQPEGADPKAKRTA